MRDQSEKTAVGTANRPQFEGFSQDLNHRIAPTSDDRRAEQRPVGELVNNGACLRNIRRFSRGGDSFIWEPHVNCDHARSGEMIEVAKTQGLALWRTLLDAIAARSDSARTS